MTPNSYRNCENRADRKSFDVRRLRSMKRASKHGKVARVLAKVGSRWKRKVTMLCAMEAQES